MTAAAPAGVGRTVHYVSLGSADGQYPSVCRAAIVTEVDPVNPNRLGLAVLNPEGIFLHSLAGRGTSYSRCDSGLRGGTWHWAQVPIDNGGCGA